MSTERPTVSQAAHGKVTGPGAIAFERLLQGPIDRVWDYLTVPELRRTWLADGPMALIKGGYVDMRFDNQALNEYAEPVPKQHEAHAQHARDTGIITACGPPRLLAFTWDDPRGSTEVRFELEPQGERVLLRLTHRRLDDLDTAISVASGWHTHLDFLTARLTGSPLPLFWTVHANLEAAYNNVLADGAAFARRGHGQLFALPGNRWRVVFERIYELPLEEVWRAACEPPGIDAWYPAKLRHSGQVGGWVRQTFAGQDGAPDVTMAEGELTAYDPPRLLEFVQPPEPDAATEDMRHPQTLRLEANLVEKGTEQHGPTRLTLVHEFTGDDTAARVMPGWHSCLDHLDDALAVGDRPSQERSNELRAWYAAWI